ncbi:hypothetical protein CCP2SC5_1890006 [Azospirillaceae bacterium]
MRLWLRKSESATLGLTLIEQKALNKERLYPWPERLGTQSLNLSNLLLCRTIKRKTEMRTTF